jgi:hypothetical protein
MAGGDADHPAVQSAALHCLSWANVSVAPIVSFLQALGVDFIRWTCPPLLSVVALSIHVRAGTTS